MGLLQEKLSKYREPQKYMEAGIYPYFREIDSHQDTEVTMETWERQHERQEGAHVRF